MPRFPTNPKRAAKAALQDIETFGLIEAPMTKQLFKRGNTLSDKQLEVRDEVVYLLWDALGKDENKVRKYTKMHQGTIHKIIKARTQGKQRIATAVLEHELKLEEIRYSGRKDVIDRLNQYSLDFLEYARSKMEELTAIEAVKAFAIFTDKGLLLSGQPTSRIAKTDERMMSNEQLEQKSREYIARMQKLGVIDGEIEKRSA